MNPLPDGTTAFRNDDGGIAAKFYKMLGVDLKYSSSPSGWISLQRFEFIERNKYASPNTAVNYTGYSNLRYRIEGDNLYLVPLPMTGQTVRLWYIPAPTNLQYTLICSASINSNVFALSDTTNLTPGMKTFVTTTQQSNLNVLSVGSNSVVVTGSITANCVNTPISFYNDNSSFDGISGWENYVILSAAMKALMKQDDTESVALLNSEFQGLIARIDALSEGRDAGQAQHVSDVLGIQGYGGDGMGDW